MTRLLAAIAALAVVLPAAAAPAATYEVGGRYRFVANTFVGTADTAYGASASGDTDGHAVWVSRAIRGQSRWDARGGAIIRPWPPDRTC
jgi:hypothetical protein